MNKGIQLGGGTETSNSKVYALFKLLKAFVCNSFKGEQCGVNSAESRHLTHNSPLLTVHSHAFTLAETLIVMGIIGVVAALTIPNLNSSTNDMEKVAKFKKIYAELVQAHDRAIAVYGPIETWPPSDQKYIDRLTEFMKVTKVCNSSVTSESTVNDCANYKVHYLKDTPGTPTTQWYNYRSAILANGASIGVSIDSNCSDYYYDSYTTFRFIGCGAILLDIDGPKKGKNTYGVDLFILGINKEYGITPGYNNSRAYFESYPNNCFELGLACGQWIMDFGNMDYLKASYGVCKNDTTKRLGWGAGKAHSCK